MASYETSAKDYISLQLLDLVCSSTHSNNLQNNFNKLDILSLEKQKKIHSWSHILLNIVQGSYIDLNRFALLIEYKYFIVSSKLFSCFKVFSQCLLNCVSCVVTWVTFVGAQVAWVKFLRGLHGSKYFLRGSIFYMSHHFYVSCVGQVYFMRRPLHESKFFVGFNFLGVLGQGLQKSQLALSQ